MTTFSPRKIETPVADEIFSVAEKLSPARVLSVDDLPLGGNSRIYKVTTEQNSYALKRYPKPTLQDPRNRLETETKALSCMRRHGFTNVPEMVTSDSANAFGLLSWCEGEAVPILRDEDMVEFAEFLVALGRMSQSARDEGLPLASEACTSGTSILSHIHARMEKLRLAAREHAGLASFLEEDFFPALRDFENEARKAYATRGISFEDPLPHKRQTLTPSDFGGHNALRGPHGLIFLDFEYFGWDDPVTSAANFVLHPAMNLTEAQKKLLLSQMKNYFAARDPHYTTRLEALFPLYAARWAAIILGEFIPENWKRRLQSGRHRPADIEKVQNTQLAKARTALQACLHYSK